MSIAREPFFSVASRRDWAYNWVGGGFMQLSSQLQKFLDSHQTKYAVSSHSTAFTAREVASAEHLPAREVAKVVVVYGDGTYHMIVVPANRLVDFQEVRHTLGLSQARLATEDELAKLFPDCELGAMPPIGQFYKLPVYMDNSLLDEGMIAFNAGTHRTVIHMKTEDYRTLVQPTMVSLAREAAVRHDW
jgi:Ala-tRNA(Pro) deacylase